MKADIAGFSIDIERLKESIRVHNKPVLDVGCRGFQFADEVAYIYDGMVYALDPSPDVSFPSTSRIKFFPYALVAKESDQIQKISFALNSDAEAHHVVAANTPAHGSERVVQVDAVGLFQFMKMVAVQSWAAIKLNCEGSEYELLYNWPGPIADQISVSFHEHTGADRLISTDSVVSHLRTWYKPVRHVRDARYGAGHNYWDSLFVLK